MAWDNKRKVFHFFRKRPYSNKENWIQLCTKNLFRLDHCVFHSFCAISRLVAVKTPKSSQRGIVRGEFELILKKGMLELCLSLK